MTILNRLIFKYKIYRTRKIINIITEVIMYPFKNSNAASDRLAFKYLSKASAIANTSCNGGLSDFTVIINNVSTAYIHAHANLTLSEQIYFAKLVRQLRKLHGGYKYDY